MIDERTVLFLLYVYPSSLVSNLGTQVLRPSWALGPVVARGPPRTLAPRESRRPSLVGAGVELKPEDRRSRHSYLETTKFGEAHTSKPNVEVLCVGTLGPLCPDF